MNDDAYCLFIILAGILGLAIPSAGQVLFAVFAFVLAVAAHLAPVAEGHGPHEHQRALPSRLPAPRNPREHRP